jgi:hypothetical protein
MANSGDLKSENIQAVRKCFYTHGCLSVNEAEKMTGLSHGSAVNVFRVLEQSGEILLSEKTGNRVGRKTHRYILNCEFRHFLAIDIRREHGEFSSRSWRMNLNGEESDVRTRAFPAMDDTYLHTEIETMMSAYPDTDMILISTPGVCEDGIITNGETFRMDIGSWIEEKYGVPCVIENDVNVAAIGFANEHAECRNIAVIYQAEQGIFGCGILINGRLYNGFSHAAGELRYLPHMEERKKEPPEILLKEMIQSVAAVLNPDVIGYASDPVKKPLEFESEIPSRHMPSIIHINDLDAYRRKGLYSIGMYNMAENRNEGKK